MLQLLELLLKERWRKLQAQYGWAAFLSAGLLLMLGAWWITAKAAPFLKVASPEQIGIGLNTFWIAWVIVGVLTGKDLTWQISLERLTLFPISFLGLYSVSLLLGFLSFPLLLGLGALEAGSLARNPSPADGLIGLLAFGLLVFSVRLPVSLVRTALYRGNALRKPMRKLLWALIGSVSALVAVAMIYPNGASLLPGYQLALILSGSQPARYLLLLATVVLCLTALDYSVQREVVFQGIAGPCSQATPRSLHRILYLFRPSPYATLWRINFLEFLRNRNALLLWIWGTAYGFGFLYISKEGGQGYYMAFCWMVLIFHGALRGNLLGVDRSGAWLYFVFPIPVESAIRAKNSTLSVFQMSMVGAVLLPALLQTTPGMTTPIEWLGVLSFAVSTILLGEALGSMFSVLYPEPIDRFSRYSGGTSVGALSVPTAQALSLGIFFAYTSLAPRFLTPFATAVPLLVVPVLLWLARSVILYFWVRKTLIDRSETILRKLSAF